MKNVLIRSISGILFLLIMIGAIGWCPVSYAVLFGLITVGMMYEFLRMAGRKENETGFAITLSAGTGLFLLTFLHAGYDLDIRWLLWLVPFFSLLFISNLYIRSYNKHVFRTGKPVPERENNGYEYFPFSTAALLYIAVPMSLCNLIVFRPDGTYSGNLLLGLFILLWATDVGAYCFGSLFGQKNGHKLFPSISPKKSWEGFWGGIFSAAAAGIVLFYTGLLSLTIFDTIVLSLLIGIFGVFGDLVESQLKRNFGVKDSGNIMPGHGGMLDRFDGALLAFPVAVVYLEFFATI